MDVCQYYDGKGSDDSSQKAYILMWKSYIFYRLYCHDWNCNIFGTNRL